MIQADRLITASLFLGLLASSAATALSPPNPTADTPWDEAPGTAGNQQTYSGVGAVTAAFNNARRQEEAQLGLRANALGELALPGQSAWDAMTPSEKALMITNAERTARDGINYPNHGTVLGLPLEAVESHVNKMAEDYAQYMVDHNFWAHNVPARVSAPPFAGTGSFTRISGHPVIGDGAGSNGGNCRQFLPYAENLYIAAHSNGNRPIPMLVERAIYGFLYDDAGSAWGHRVAMFIQDRSLSGGTGFNNDRGSPASEGMMGIGIAGKTDGSYDPVGFGGQRFPNQQAVVWAVYDPSADAGCNVGVPVNMALADNSWRLVSLPATPPPGANTVAGLFGDDINGTYGSDWIVFAFNESAGSTGAYINPGLDGVLVPGEAYWVFQRTGRTVTLDMPSGSQRTPVTSSSACSAAAGCLQHNITSRDVIQWNSIGNPFYTAPAINNLRVTTSSGQCADSDGCSISEAADRNAANVQLDRFWTYNGTTYNERGSGDSMQPWEGYWSPSLPGADGRSPVLQVPRN